MTTPRKHLAVTDDFLEGAIWLLTILIKADKEWADPGYRERFQSRGLATKYHFALAYVLTHVLKKDGVSAEDATDQALAVIEALPGVEGMNIGEAQVAFRQRFHGPDECEGESCCLHNPSDHHMVEWPLKLRTDAFAFPLMERICEHGIGHPDPDSVAHLERVHPSKGWDIHGCDGCCGVER